MKIRLLRDPVVEQLRDAVTENLSAYRSGDFMRLAMDPANYYELVEELDEVHLKKMRTPTKSADYEVENCLALYGALPGLSPYNARDERLWVYMTHTILLDYTRARWPIPDADDKATEHILTHFFARANRQIERDNSASRLWWMSHLCSRVEQIGLEKALTSFLFRTDVRASIIERPTIAQSSSVFSVLLRRLLQSMESDQKLFERKNFRRLMVELNSVGGVQLLDALVSDDLEKIIDDSIEKCAA